MLTRIISGAVGVVIAALVLFLHNTIVLNIAVGLLGAGMIYEVMNAAQCLDMRISIVTSILYAVVMPFTVNTRFYFMTTLIYALLMFAGFVFLHHKYNYDRFFLMFAVSLLITHSMSTLILMHELSSKNGIMYLIMGLCGAWLADTGAYFVGTFIGKNKLCPDISPKKTIEGFVGGIIITGLLFILINFIYAKIASNDTGEVSVNYFAVCILGMILAAVGTLGDLSASVLKRQCGIKDYGNIMPGHGGVMDRFDSVLFVAPSTFLFVSLFNIYY